MFVTDSTRAPELTAEAVTPPSEFLEALLSLRAVTPPPHLSLTEIPAPQKITPFSAALHVESPSEDGDIPATTGRFVILYEPKKVTDWAAKTRIIVQVRSEMDAEMGADPLLGEVIWTWLHDALDQNSVDSHRLKGTVTRELSETFGNLQLTRSNVEVELKASWSTDSKDLAPHLQAWLDLVSHVFGQSDPDLSLMGPVVHGF